MINKILFSTLLVLSALGCQTQPDAPTPDQASQQTTPAGQPGASIEAKQVAAQEQSTHVAEIQFKKTSAVLTESHKKQIAETIKKAQTMGAVKEIQVLTWADAEYPSVHTKKLSSAERKLVEQRNDSIEKYIESMAKDTDVKYHSMAERPGLLTDMMNSTGSRLKKSFELAGIPNTDSSVKTPSKASRSVIIVETK